MAPPLPRQSAGSRRPRRAATEPEIKEEDEQFQGRARVSEVIDLEMEDSDPDEVVHVDQEEVAAHGKS